MRGLYSQLIDKVISKINSDKKHLYSLKVLMKNSLK